MQTAEHRSLTVMDKWIPLSLSMTLALIGVVADMITGASEINAATTTRVQVTYTRIFRSIPANVCLGAFSFDT